MEGIFDMIDPVSISFLFDDRGCGNLNTMRKEIREEEERKIREEEEWKIREEEERKMKEDFNSSSNQQTNK